MTYINFILPELFYFCFSSTLIKMIKKLISTTHHPKKLDAALLIARVGIASLMLFHGIPKLLRLFSEGAIQFVDPFGIGENITFLLAIFAEFVCSILIFFGVFTRLAVIAPMITMLTAVFIFHVDDGFGKQELGLHYLLVYLVLLIAGAGKYSVDHHISKK